MGRGGGGGKPAMEWLKAATRKAEAVVLVRCWLRREWRSACSSRTSSTSPEPVEAVLQRMAGPGGRRPAAADLSQE